MLGLRLTNCKKCRLIGFLVIYKDNIFRYYDDIASASSATSAHKTQGLLIINCQTERLLPFSAKPNNT